MTVTSVSETGGMSKEGASVAVGVFFNIAVAVAPNVSDEHKRIAFFCTVPLLILAILWWLWAHFKTPKTKPEVPRATVSARDIANSTIATAARDVHQNIYQGFPPSAHDPHASQSVFIAIDKLKALLGEGDIMANRFQIEYAPKPTFIEVQEWQARVVACARQNALAGRVQPHDLKKLSEKWDAEDLLRIEALLQDYGCFENVDDLGRITFRTVWGQVKRLEELIAMIEHSSEPDHPLLMTQALERIAAAVEKLQDEKRQTLGRIRSEMERADRNANTIGRRAGDVATSINEDLVIVEIMDAMNVPATREISEALKKGPKRIESIEQRLIDEAYEIDHEMTWPTFRKLGVAAVNLNAGIQKFNEQATAPLCHDLLARVEVIRKHIVEIQAERAGHIDSGGLS